MNVLLFLLFGFLSSVLFYLAIVLIFKKDIYAYTQIPARKTILVLGAGLEENGKPSDILIDRLFSAHKLINDTSPTTVILSGARSHTGLSEPEAMESFLLDKKVDPSILELDEMGQSTFHSLLNISKLTPAPITTVISQKFHLFRALLIARLLGINCIGLIADNLSFAGWKTTYWYVREIIANPYNIGKILCHRIGKKIYKS